MIPPQKLRLFVQSILEDNLDVIVMSGKQDYTSFLHSQLYPKLSLHVGEVDKKITPFRPISMPLRVWTTSDPLCIAIFNSIKHIQKLPKAKKRILKPTANDYPFS
jgi:hypothetical protein